MQVQRIVINREVFRVVVLVATLTVAATGFTAEANRVADAAERNESDVVRALIEEGVDVKSTQPDGATALHWAAYWDQVQMAQRLITAGAEVDAKNDLAITPLVLACRNGSDAMVQVLLRAGADARSVGQAGETVLMTCARTGPVSSVMKLLAGGADPNATEQDRGQTALMWAAAGNHVAVVKALVEAGADLTARSQDGFTPLLFSARAGAIEVARLLVEAGADVDQVTPDGYSPLLVAAASIDAVTGSDYRLVVSQSPHEELARYFLDHGADRNKSDQFGMTALHFAVDTEKMTLLKALLETGAEPNAVLTRPLPFRRGDYVSRNAYDGASPFWLATRDANLEMMRVLLNAGADPFLANAAGVTPLMVASGLGENDARRPPDDLVLQAVRLLLDHGANVSATNRGGQTALHGAAAMWEDQVIQLLVDRGADVNVEDKRGRTPLYLVERSNANAPSESTAALLRRLGSREPVALQ